MKILLVETYYGGSHKKWADGFKDHSRHEVKLLTMPAVHWKWRMHGGAVTLSEELNAARYIPDLIIVTDMMDVATFKANLKGELTRIPIVCYFHENQITYPWSASDEDVKLSRDNHYGYINYTSALVSDMALFNSKYHLDSFVGGLSKFLSQFPDFQNKDSIGAIDEKSKVMHLGLDLSVFDDLKPSVIDYPKRATILWNHRWEYDKNPEGFFETLFELKRRGWEFNLVVLGERYKKEPGIFSIAKEKLAENIVHWGFVESASEYAYWLWFSDILPVTSNQDFFGGSVVEAMYCNVKPLLPRRLAYPEHVPEKLHSTFFYEESGLVSKLQSWVRDISVLRKQQTRSFVEKYDWSACIQRFDSLLEKVTKDSAMNQ